MRRTVISTVLFAVILLCACTRAAASKTNLTIINDCSDAAEIYSVAISANNSTNCGSNADNTALANGEALSFEMGDSSECAFDVGIADKSGRIISLDSFVFSFDEGQKYTLYIIEDASGISVVSDRS